MQLQTILNRVQRHRGFVFQKAKLVEKRDGPVVEVDIEPRSNSRAICSGCGRAGSGYDREQTPRSFQFVPLWGIAVFFLYTMRRVDCRQCGVKVERVPWADGKYQLTTTYLEGLGFVPEVLGKMSDLVVETSSLIVTSLPSVP